MKEKTILKAYALASQCKYAEAEFLLKSDHEALGTPYGLDLYARILYAVGKTEAARHIWEELLRSSPDYEAAKNALDADQNALRFCPSELMGMSRILKLSFVGIAAIALIIAFSIGRACHTSIGKACHTLEVNSTPEPPSVIAEITITGRINGKVLSSLCDGFLTNLTEESVLVIRGGSGRYVTDRLKKLAVIADCIKEVANVPFSKMYFQPADKSVDEIVLQIVPALKDGKVYRR